MGLFLCSNGTSQVEGKASWPRMYISLLSMRSLSIENGENGCGGRGSESERRLEIDYMWGDASLVLKDNFHLLCVWCCCYTFVLWVIYGSWMNNIFIAGDIKHLESWS